MPKRDDDFNLALKRYNAMLSEYLQWQETTAQKAYTDRFGAPINSGDVYFKRTLGGSYSNVRRLSRASMNAFLEELFDHNLSLEKLADRCLHAREAEKLKGLLETARSWDQAAENNVRLQDGGE